MALRILGAALRGWMQWWMVSSKAGLCLSGQHYGEGVLPGAVVCFQIVFQAG